MDNIIWGRLASAIRCLCDSWLLLFREIKIMGKQPNEWVLAVFLWVWMNGWIFGTNNAAWWQALRGDFCVDERVTNRLFSCKTRLPYFLVKHVFLFLVYFHGQQRLLPRLQCLLECHSRGIEHLLGHLHSFQFYLKEDVLKEDDRCQFLFKRSLRTRSREKAFFDANSLGNSCQQIDDVWEKCRRKRMSVLWFSLVDSPRALASQSITTHHSNSTHYTHRSPPSRDRPPSSGLCHQPPSAIKNAVGTIATTNHR
jgi:hypothetical protein